MTEQKEALQEETVIGKVSFIMNSVTVKSANGEIRELYVNSPIFIGDTILTGENGMVTFIIGEGEGLRVDLGRSSELLLDEQFLSENYADSYEDTEQLKMALLEGEFDPTEEFAAPASGGEAPSGGGGQHVFQVDLTGQELLASSVELETEGVHFLFADPVALPIFDRDFEILPQSAQTPLRSATDSGESDDVLSFDGAVFGYSSFSSNFPILELIISEMQTMSTRSSLISSDGEQTTLSELLNRYFGETGLDFNTFGAGTPDAQLIATDVPNGDQIARIETDGTLGEFFYDEDGLKFTPNEGFSGGAEVSFTIIYNNGDTQECSATIAERYLKVGSIANDWNYTGGEEGGDYEFNSLAAVDEGFGYGFLDSDIGYVVGEGSGAIIGGDAGDILIGDSFNFYYSSEPVYSSMQSTLSVEGPQEAPEGQYPYIDDAENDAMNDDIYGQGGDDFLVGDSLDTRILNGDVLEAVNGYLGTDYSFGDGEEGPNLGWYAFTLLELFNEDWDRNDTIDYLLDEDNQAALNPDLLLGRGEFELAGGDDYIFGGDGDDLIFGNAGWDLLVGDAGDDAIGGGDGSDWIEGGSGNDALAGGSGYDIIFGDSGDDIIAGGNGGDDIDGGSGDDTITGDNAVVVNGQVIIAEDDALDYILGGSGTADTHVNVGKHENLAGIENEIDDTAFPPADNVDDLAPLLPEIEVTG